MGLRDVAALAEAIVDAARLGLDIGGADVLERYQRWRRFDTMAMGVATDGLNRLFSNESDALRIVRDVGLGLVDRMPALKSFFIREAAGVTGDVPKLLCEARRCLGEQARSLSLRYARAAQSSEGKYSQYSELRSKLHRSRSVPRSSTVSAPSR